MSIKRMKFSNQKPRYRIKNLSRFIAVILVILLAATAVFIIQGKNREGDESRNTAIVVTPTAMPTPSPIPTPLPFEIPEGKTMEPVLIVLDPGHGGGDGGTLSPYKKGFYEKDITLYMAKKTEEYLKEKNIKAVLTRDGDFYLSPSNKEDLLGRANIANDNKATFFVSIHVNAYDLKYKGAAKVNGMDVYYGLKDKTTYDGFTEERLAEIIGGEISKASGIKLNALKTNDFSVLRNTKMPAVLIETAYITNKEDHARLESAEFRDNTAKGIANAIELALNELEAFEHEGTLYVFQESGG